MNPTVALPGSMTWMGIRSSSGSRCPQSPNGLPLSVRGLVQNVHLQRVAFHTVGFHRIGRLRLGYDLKELLCIGRIKATGNLVARYGELHRPLQPVSLDDIIVCAESRFPGGAVFHLRSHDYFSHLDDPPLGAMITPPKIS